MSSRGHEFYWRIYLLLNEGVPLISKLIIAGEIKRTGSDLGYFLGQNKDQLKTSYRLNESEIEAIFPASGRTDINKWSASMFIGVILTVFRSSLKQNERKQIRNIETIQKVLCANSEKCVFDDETYDDHKTSLEESLSFLASVLGDEVKKEIVELIDIYTKKPLNAKEVMQHVEGSHLSGDTKQQVGIFLDSIRPDQNENDENTNVDVYENNDISVPTDNIVNSGEDMQEMVAEGHNTNNDGDRQLVDTIDGGSIIYVRENRAQPVTTDSGNHVPLQDGAENCSPSEENAAIGRDEIDDAENSCSSEDDAVNGSDEIVNEAINCVAEDVRKRSMPQWQGKDLENILREKNFTSLTKDKLDSWQNEDVNIAVLGRTGVGKSRFINEFRGCKCKDDPLYAPVGSTETTIEPKAYSHPKNIHLKLWDLPGIGTKHFPRERYIKDRKIAFDSYDIYLIISSDRFTEDETYFAEKIDKIGKVFLFVRSRVDINLDDVLDVKAEVDKIREDCLKNLETTKLKSKDVYLISSKCVGHKFLDFSKLVDRLILSMPTLKKEALLYSLQFNTKALLREKKAALEPRFKTVAAWSATGAIVPIPGISFAADIYLISKELAFYRETLGITDSDLKVLAEKTGKDINQLKREYKLKTFDMVKLTTKDETKLGIQIGPLLKDIATSEALRSSVKIILPVIGCVLGAGISAATTYYFLKSMLKILLEDADKMMDILLKETGSEILHTK